MQDSLEISVQEVAGRLAQEPELALIDVREDFEREICALPGSRQLTEALAEEIVKSWQRETEMVFLCHHGFRSRAAAEYFLQQGFAKVRNMSGGIDAWAREVDAGLPRY